MHVQEVADLNEEDIVTYIAEGPLKTTVVILSEYYSLNPYVYRTA